MWEQSFSHSYFCSYLISGILTIVMITWIMYVCVYIYALHKKLWSWTDMFTAILDKWKNAVLAGKYTNKMGVPERAPFAGSDKLKNTDDASYQMAEEQPHL